MGERNPKKPCQECHKETALYQCPRCNFRSCSLTCCKAHKERTGCNGKRDRTAFVPISRMTDLTMQSDYHFLEDIVGNVESSKRSLLSSARVNDNNNKRARTTTTLATVDHQQHQLLSGPTPPSHPKWRHFQQQAASRGTTVLFLPEGMERHKSNRSHIKSDKLVWTVEWILEGTGDAYKRKVMLVSEDSIVWEQCRERFLSFDDDSYTLLLKQLPCPANRATFVQISKSCTLETALKDMTVIEYPTIHVVHSSKLAEFPRAIEDITSEMMEATT